MITTIKGDCAIEMESIPSESVDVILTDPPYLYLKNQKLDIPFDEQKVFSEYKRVLKKGGFIILFGRGTSFYRWNAALAAMGFTFKEEIVWHKSYCTSPLMPLSRVHETVSIHCKGKGVIRKVKVPYVEMKQHDIPSIIQDIKRLKAVFKNTKSFDAVMEYLETNQMANMGLPKNLSTSVSSHIEGKDRGASVVKALKVGMVEKSIIRSDMEMSNRKESSIVRFNSLTGDRACNAANSIQVGMNEKSIIRQSREHYRAIHPTQKPVRLLERLLKLVVEPFSEITVLDSFAGSMSTGEACGNLGLNCILIEKDEGYYQAGCERMRGVLKNIFEGLLL